MKSIFGLKRLNDTLRLLSKHSADALFYTSCCYQRTLQINKLPAYLSKGIFLIQKDYTLLFCKSLHCCAYGIIWYGLLGVLNWKYQYRLYTSHKLPQMQSKGELFSSFTPSNFY